jgi:hypothetical protein
METKVAFQILLPFCAPGPCLKIRGAPFIKGFLKGLPGRANPLHEAVLLSL